MKSLLAVALLLVSTQTFAYDQTFESCSLTAWSIFENLQQYQLQVPLEKLKAIKCKDGVPKYATECANVDTAYSMAKSEGIDTAYIAAHVDYIKCSGEVQSRVARGPLPQLESGYRECARSSGARATILAAIKQGTPIEVTRDKMGAPYYDLIDTLYRKARDTNLTSVLGDSARAAMACIEAVEATERSSSEQSPDKTKKASNAALQLKQAAIQRAFNTCKAKGASVKACNELLERTHQRELKVIDRQFAAYLNPRINQDEFGKEFAVCSATPNVGYVEIVQCESQLADRMEAAVNGQPLVKEGGSATTTLPGASVDPSAIQATTTEVPGSAATPSSPIGDCTPQERRLEECPGQPTQTAVNEALPSDLNATPVASAQQSCPSGAIECIEKVEKERMDAMLKAVEDGKAADEVRKKEQFALEAKVCAVDPGGCAVKASRDLSVEMVSNARERDGAATRSTAYLRDTAETYRVMLNDPAVRANLKGYDPGYDDNTITLIVDDEVSTLLAINEELAKRGELKP